MLDEEAREDLVQRLTSIFSNDAEARAFADDPQAFVERQLPDGVEASDVVDALPSVARQSGLDLGDPVTGGPSPADQLSRAYEGLVQAGQLPGEAGVAPVGTNLPTGETEPPVGAREVGSEGLEGPLAGDTAAVDGPATMFGAGAFDLPLDAVVTPAPELRAVEPAFASGNSDFQLDPANAIDDGGHDIQLDPALALPDERDPDPEGDEGVLDDAALDPVAEQDPEPAEPEVEEPPPEPEPEIDGIDG